jgi:hypothetical protein
MGRKKAAQHRGRNHSWQEEHAIPDTSQYAQPPPAPLSSLLIDDAFSDDPLLEYPQPGMLLQYITARDLAVIQIFQ